jgi:hypothetical protein
LAGTGSNRGLGQQWIGAEFRTFRLEVMLSHEKIVEPQTVGENALANLVHQYALIALVHLGERTVIDLDLVRRGDGREVAGAVMKHAYFDHESGS